MNNSKYRFTLDLRKEQSQMSISVSRHDTAVRLYISLTDGGKPYLIEDGCTAFLFGKRADEEPLLHRCMIMTNTEIVYDFEPTISCVEGIVNCEIRLYGKDGKIITAPMFIIVVDEQLVDDEDVEKICASPSYALDQILGSEQARVDAEVLRDEAEKARKSVWVRYSAYADGTSFKEAWESGMDYIGIASAKECPTDKSGFDWMLFKGEKGQDGHSPVVTIQNGYWYIDGKNTGELVSEGAQGETGNGIASIIKTRTEGLTDTYTITFTDGTTTNFTVTNGKDGEQGSQGIQGIQGIQGEKGATGDKGEKGDKGDKGDTGKGFTISKTYTSIAEMNSAYATDGVALNAFVLINTGNVEDADNAKLYVKLEGGYSYLTDLSGSQGIRGEKGDKGDKGEKGDPGEKGNQGEQGIQGVQGEKGEKGDQGEKGDRGEQGIQGEKGADGVDGLDGYTPVKGTDYFTPSDIAKIVDAVYAKVADGNGVAY